MSDYWYDALGWFVIGATFMGTLWMGVAEFNSRYRIVRRDSDE